MLQGFLFSIQDGEMIFAPRYIHHVRRPGQPMHTKILSMSGNRSVTSVAPVVSASSVSFLTDATLSQNPRGQAHEEQGHDRHLVSQITDHVNFSVSSASLPLAAIVGIFLGGGGASAGSAAVGVVRGEGIHLVCVYVVSEYNMAKD